MTYRLLSTKPFVKQMIDYQSSIGHHSTNVWYFIKNIFSCYDASNCGELLAGQFLGVSVLTHRGRDKMATISQTTFSSAFTWMNMFEFDWNFTEVCS